LSQEKLYIGTKVIRAKRCDRVGSPGYRVKYPDGYISWSPKDVFESAYREVTSTELELVHNAVEDEPQTCTSEEKS